MGGESGRGVIFLLLWRSSAGYHGRPAQYHSYAGTQAKTGDKCRLFNLILGTLPSNKCIVLNKNFLSVHIVSYASLAALQFFHLEFVTSVRFLENGGKERKFRPKLLPLFAIAIN